jgi:TolB-like protein/Tfp pilus assembly protein PilF
MLLRFGTHALDTDRRELRRDGTLVPMEPQVFDLIVYLIENRERVVSKDDLVAAVWRGRIVSDSTLTSRINAARRALGDTGEEQRVVRTVARKGFRFVGELADGNARTPSPAHAERPGIAVLPFSNMSGDPEQEYFSDGISEDIITGLSRLRWFLVIARNSSFVYKGHPAPVKQVGEDLGVGYVLEGSVRKSGDRVRITAQLNDVASGSHLWAERYDRSLSDVFTVQDEITEAIVSAIEPQLYQAENFRAQRKAPESLDAWDLVMRALSHYWRVTRADNMVAQALLEKAISLDPGYGQAAGVLATSYTFTAHMGWMEMADAMQRAEAAAKAAIRADADDAWAHHALGSVHLVARRFDDSIAEFETALGRNPNFAPAQAYHGLTLTYCGRWQDGTAAVQRALRLSPRDPLSAIYHGILGYARFVGRDYEGAIKESREALRQRADFVGAHRVLTAAYGVAGRIQEAQMALDALTRAQPGVSLNWIARNMPIHETAEMEHYLEGFRRAGLS